ncbi:hypothetical protein FACS189459_3150 [Bacilli bacterium]|nr:hypothetical protein FACS189459_3150 [Bacilli bacterium]
MYDVKFQNESNTSSFPYYMSAGITTRMIGDLILVHGDDNGLVMPFALAPVQVAILTIFADKDENVKKVANELYTSLSNIYDVKLDNSNNGFGFKINEQEVNGTPFCIVIGPKDIANNQCTLIRRDNQIKQTVNIDNVIEAIASQKQEYSDNLYNKAKKHLDNSIVEVNNMEEFKKAIAEHKIVLAA